jgi:hypothetical protein
MNMIFDSASHVQHPVYPGLYPSFYSIRSITALQAAQFRVYPIKNFSFFQREFI